MEVTLPKYGCYLPAGRDTLNTKVILLYMVGLGAVAIKMSFNDAIAAIRASFLSLPYSI
jgi:hypothetical protein